MNRKELKAAARESLKDSGSGPKKVTLVFLLSYAALMALCFIFTELVGNMDTSGNYLSSTLMSEAKVMALSCVVSYGMQALTVLLTVGYAAVALDMKERNPVGYGSLLSGVRMAGRVILLYILKSLFVALWSYAFSMPISYLLMMALMSQPPALTNEMVMLILAVYVGIAMFLVSYRYRMAYFVLMDEPELGARAALKKAVTINRGHRMQIFLLDLSFLPWILLSVLTCGILLIWKLPYMVTTYACAYDEMKADYARKQAYYRSLREKMMQNRMQ